MIPESAVNSSRPLANGSRNGANLKDSASSKSQANYFLSPAESSSAILASIDTPSLSIFSKMPNFNLEQDLVSLRQDEEDFNLPDVALNNSSDEFGPGEKSFLLIDGKENLKVKCYISYIIQV